MRKTSLIEKVRLFGRSGIDIVEVLGRSTIFLFHALLGRGGIGGGFGLLVKQLHSVGVMSLVIIVVSGVFIGMVLALQGFNILSSYGSEQAVGQMVALTLLRELGPVVTALLFAGRAGSALTAEIGNMKSTEHFPATAGDDLQRGGYLGRFVGGGGLAGRLRRLLLGQHAKQRDLQR
jgi:phospholipid/cholesterol/gamma-HCH transport system permease protein